MKIESNKVKCLLCNQVIESKTKDDSATCKCKNVTVRGGLAQLRRTGKDLDQYEELSKFHYDSPDDLEMM